MGMIKGDGFMDGIFEVFAHAHITQTTNKVIVPINNMPTGCYIVIMLPLVTAQDGIDEQTYIFKAGEFVVYKTDKSIFNGVSYLFNFAGTSDYWSINVAYVDTATKDAITIQCGNGQVSFPGNHDLYIIKVKGE